MKYILAIILLATTIFAREYKASGGTGVVEFPTASNVAITAPSWVTTTTTFTGTSLIVQYTVGANTDYYKRDGVISCNGNTLTINQAGQATTVSGASFSKDRIAIGGFISIFGLDLTNLTASGNFAYDLQGTTVTILAGESKQQAKLVYISPLQVNALLPDTLPEGPATIIAESPINKVSDEVFIHTVSPDIFTQNAQGTGMAAGTLQVNRDFSTSYFPLSSTAITFSRSTDSHFLLLYGSGIRNGQNVFAILGGEQYGVIYAGPQGQYEGLDQVAIPISPGLSGRGMLNLQLIIDNVISNEVTLSF